ncbi:MAG: hypothetical protein ACI87X_001466 [Candidatus Arcticimaribacter sp.]|jgi:hypothetical protein|tara:strand:- start:1204 stop:1377 length:174 start_codon:yes stop_codon:yes gene_type:complete
MSSYKYYITVLKKVSFDEELFQKEYEKACSVLLGGELSRLKRWRRMYVTRNPNLESI